MKTKKLVFLLLLLWLIPFISNSQSTVIQNDIESYQLTEQETILFNLINDLRQQHQQTILPLSKKLCFVGQTHIDDLNANYKTEDGCSLHSWSDKGRWTPCCHSKDPSGINCMKIKPKEIAGYTGLGFELIYWGDESANALDAYNLWRDNKASIEMILCNGKWKSFQWKSLGVSLKGNYAIIWFGDKLEKAPPISEKTLVAEKQSTPEVKPAKPLPTAVPTEIKQEKEKAPVLKETTESNDNYFLIVASLKSQDAAKVALKKYKSSGYPKARIIDGGNMKRISIKSFSKEADAQAELNKLRDKYPGIWILHK